MGILFLDARHRKTVQCSTDFKIGDRVQVHVSPDDCYHDKYNDQIGIIRHKLRKRVYDLELESGALIWIGGTRMRHARVELEVGEYVQIKPNPAHSSSSDKKYTYNKYSKRIGQVTRFDKESCWVRLYPKEKITLPPKAGILNCHDGTIKRITVQPDLDDNTERCFFVAFYF